MSREQRRGIAHLPNVCANLDPQDVRVLLDTLCVRLGFCLPPDEIRQLVGDPPPDVDGFVEAVFRAEGMDVLTAERRLVRQVRLVVAETFLRAAAAGDGD